MSLRFVPCFVSAICAFVFFASPASAESGEPNRSSPVKIALPVSMEYVDVSKLPEARSVIIAARSKVGGFPTVNILRESGAIPGDGSVSRFGDELASQYRSLAYANVTVSAAGPRLQSVYPGVSSAEVGFDTSDGARIAIVSYVPYLDGHLIITFLTARDQMPADRAVEEQIFHSLEIENVPAVDTTAYDSDATPTGWIIVSIIVLGVSGIVYGLLRWRRRHGA